MSILNNNNCNCQGNSNDWESETTAFVCALQEKLGLLDPAIGNAFNALVVLAKAASGAFNVTVSAAGVSITSPKLVGILVPAILMDGQARYNGTDFRKGANGASEGDQKASDTITIINDALITDGVAFYEGQVVTIIPGS